MLIRFAQQATRCRSEVFHPSAAEWLVILGRRRSGPLAKGASVTFRRVREDSVARFAENYSVAAEQTIPQAKLGADHERNLRIPDLPEVWEHLSRNPALGFVADVGQGFSFNFGRILAAVGALQTGNLFAKEIHFFGQTFQGGHAFACSVMSFVYVIGLGLIWLAPETKGQPLPE